MDWRPADGTTLDKIHKHPQAEIAAAAEAIKSNSSVLENIDQISSLCFYSGGGAEQNV